MEKQITNLTIINPDKDWVVEELNKLIDEWEAWQKDVAQIQEHPYDRNTQTEVFADGEENMLKHEILQGKTLTFLNNNIRGHGFIVGFEGNLCDRTDLRLSYRVKHRLHQLRILQASLKYPKSVACEDHNSKQYRKQTASELPFPEKVTFIWLFKHVTVKYWISFFGFILASFLIGIQASRLSLVQEIFKLRRQTLQGSMTGLEQAESTNIFAEVSKDGSILRSNNFPWEIRKSNDQDGNILYTIVDRMGDATAVSVVPDNPKYTVYQSIGGMVIKFTCSEEEISNFTIKLKY